MKESRFSARESSFTLLLMINSFMFMSQALYTPFLSAYYKQQGITSSQIGILQTIAPIFAILIQPLWASRSDKTGKAKTYAAVVVIGTIFSLYTFYLGNSFGNFLFSSCMIALFTTSIHPLLDAIVVRNADYHNYNFAYIRLGGTIGFAIVTLLIGIYLKQHPSSQFMASSIAYMVLLVLILRLPKSENHQPIAKKTHRKSFKQLLQISDIFTNKAIYYVLIFAFIFQLGASILGGFLGVYAVELGYGQREVGLLSCTQALSEIPILLFIRKLTKRFGSLQLISCASLLMSVRLLVATGGSLTFLLCAQAMQGFTYMIIHFACITFISENVKEGNASRGQSVLYIIQSGLAMTIGYTCGGFVIDWLGIRTTYLVMSALVFTASVIVILILKKNGHYTKSTELQNNY